MLKRLVGSMYCLLGTLAAYWLYALFAVPMIEPARSAALQVDEEYWQAPPSARRLALKTIFPDGAWELDNPKTIENRQGILLFRDYQQHEGELVISPCTLVLFSEEPQSESSGRVFIMQSPSGAVIESNDILEVSPHGSATSTNGRLIGDVSIYSPETAPGKNDEVRFITRNIQIDDNRIWTTHDVWFEFGPHRGRGRDLFINLTTVDSAAPTGDDATGSTLARVDSLELVEVDEISLQLQHNLFDRQLSAETATKSDKPVLAKITCDGEFRLDFAESKLSIADNISVTLSDEDGILNDQLKCEQLSLEFGQLPAAHAAGDNNTNSDWMTSLSVLGATARGNPIVLEAPSSDLSIRTSKLEFDLTQGRITVEDPEQSVFKYGSHQFNVPYLRYDLPPEQEKLGTFEAKGAGEYVGVLEDGTDERIRASWQRDCLLRKQDDEHVLSLVGKADLTFSKRGKMSSDQLHIWVREDAAQDQHSIVPTKMAAIGNVILDTPELHGQTKRVDIWINEPRLNAPKPASDPLTNAIATPDDNEIPRNRYHVSGDSVQIQMTRQESAAGLEAISFFGNVQFQQQDRTAPNNIPLTLSGDVLQIQQSPQGPLNVLIQGNQQRDRPARIAIDSVELVGQVLKMNQGINQVWIDGPGHLVHAPNLESSNGSNDVKRLSWTQQMRFDGKTITMTGDVKTRGGQKLENGHQLNVGITGGFAEANLSNKIIFSQNAVPEDVELLDIRYGDNVKMQTQTVDEVGLQHSAQQFQMQEVSINQQTGDLTILGAGWLRSVQRNKKEAASANSNSSQTRVFTPGSSNMPLSYVHVKFERGGAGNLYQRFIHFDSKVAAIYGPVANWQEKLELTSTNMLGPNTVQLNCERLMIADISRGKSREPQLAITAAGNTYVESMQYTAQAARLTYSQPKDMLVLEGGRENAKLWLNQNKSATPSASARKIAVTRGSIEAFGIGFLDLSALGRPPNNQPMNPNPRPVGGRTPVPMRPR